MFKNDPGQFWSWDSKVDSISRMKWWNELIFCMSVEIQKRWKLFNYFRVGMVKNGHDHLVHETLKSAVFY